MIPPRCRSSAIVALQDDLSLCQRASLSVKSKSANDKNRLKPERVKQFEEYFAGVYGHRWANLREALKKEPRHEVLNNPFKAQAAYPPLQDYSLDAASVLPALSMDVQPGDRVADFCASPGGKSLTMIFATRGEGEWFCNDLSPERVRRLKAILHDCLPPEILKRVKVSLSDASRWGLSRSQEFDRILVDAPCSGERHLLVNERELSRWSLRGAKRLVIRQHALLCSAIDSLKAGGRLVYSTCSINPLENGGVIERLSKSRSGMFEVKTVQPDFGEPTDHGWIVLPDKFACGPIYFSVLEKSGE